MDATIEKKRGDYGMFPPRTTARTTVPSQWKLKGCQGHLRNGTNIDPASTTAQGSPGQKSFNCGAGLTYSNKTTL